MQLETEFFPVIGGELGSSADTVKHYQKQLDDFIPNVKVLVFAHPTPQAGHKCLIDITVTVVNFYQTG